MTLFRNVSLDITHITDEQKKLGRKSYNNLLRTSALTSNKNYINLEP